ncbi:MAG: hypothetical protein ABI183_16635 [Polyangiaceae bacterium]
MTRAIGLALISLAAFACGGSAPLATSPSPAPSASASTTIPPDGAAPTTSSVVHFDDLGVSLDVPSGFRVVGDDELASRIRASANPRLTASLEQRASDKKGLPLLTLSKETTSPGDGLTLTLTVATVPIDATAAELIAEQKTVMSENLAQFAVVGGPNDISVDGVAGSELTDVYSTNGSAGPVKSKAVLRLFIRRGLAFVLVAVWPQSAPPERETDARALIAGLRFYPPTASE